MMTDIKKTARFWDKLADRYAKSPIKNEEAYQKKLAITRRYFSPETTVFEFGCGTGSTAIAHAPHVKRIVAIDISSRMLEIARTKAEAGDIDNISFQQSTLEDFDAAAESFDVAMAHSILHLLEDPGSALTKISQLLKPGGVLVTSTVCLGDGNAIWRMVLPVARFLRVAPYVNILKRCELEQMISSAGLEIDPETESGLGDAAFIIARKPGSEARTGGERPE